MDGIQYINMGNKILFLMSFFKKMIYIKSESLKVQQGDIPNRD